MKNMLRRLTLQTVAVAVTVSAPGLAPYAAAGQIIAAPVNAGAGQGSLGAAGTIRGVGPNAGQSRVVVLQSVSMSAFQPRSAAVAVKTDATIVLAPALRGVVAAAADAPQHPVDSIRESEIIPEPAPVQPQAVPADAPDSLMERLRAVAPKAEGLRARLARLGKAPAAVDFDGDGGAPKPAIAAGDSAPARPNELRAADSLTPRKAAPAVEGARYYVYEANRDTKIGLAGHVAHYALKVGLISSKAAIFYMASPLLAAAYLAFIVLIPVKAAFFLKMQTKIDQTLFRPWLGKRAPFFSSRREVLAPHEELSLIPGVIKTIDTSVRQDKSYGFLKGFLGAFLTERVEHFKVLVQTDRELPAEIRAQDGALLGRMTEIGAQDTLAFSAHTRTGAAQTAWTRTVAQLFDGDVIGKKDAAWLRDEFDENWMRTAILNLLKLSAITAALGFGVMFGLHAAGVEMAKDFAEIVALTYFIMAGVYEHSNGPKVYARYFGPKRVEGGFWSRLGRFIRDAWKESVGTHENTVEVALKTESGMTELGAIARGVGASAMLGNGIRRQLALLSPVLLIVGANAIALFAKFMPGALQPLQALTSFPVTEIFGAIGLAMLAAGVAAHYAVPYLTRNPKPGIAVRTHRGLSNAWTWLALAAVTLGGAGVYALGSQAYLAGLALFSALFAVAIVIDPFSTGAKAYDMRLKEKTFPIGGLTFLIAALGAGALAFAGLPAAAFLTAEGMIAVAALLLIGMADGLRFFLSPGVEMLKTPRSTPALAKNGN